MTKGAALTDSKGMGGINAQAGFDYQLWDALARVPGWLRNPAFEGLILEGLEDFEARFFAPQAARQYLLDRYQAKAGGLSGADVRAVFASFKNFDETNPRVARVQTLVTPSLPRGLEWVARDAERVSRARKFYEPFPDVLAATDEKLEADLAAEFGPELGPFVARAAEVAIRPYANRAVAEFALAAALQDAYPGMDIPGGRVKRAFGELCELAAGSRGTMLSRRTLLDLLVTHAGVPPTPSAVLRVHVRSNVGPDMLDAVEIDATPFSGAAGAYPAPPIWRSRLVDALLMTAQWSRSHAYSRIALAGSYRLSAALAVGWAFRSATGFEIEVPTKSGTWPTDAHPVPSSSPPWTVSLPATLFERRLIVGIGVLRDPELDILKQLPGANRNNLLVATLPKPLTSAVDAQASSQVIKAAVGRAVTRHGPTAIDLFYVGPAAFGVVLGHRWNGLPPTQLWEFLPAQGRYTPTALLE